MSTIKLGELNDANRDLKYCLGVEGLISDLLNALSFILLFSKTLSLENLRKNFLQ